jgi:hypothetical protein
MVEKHFRRSPPREIQGIGAAVGPRHLKRPTDRRAEIAIERSAHAVDDHIHRPLHRIGGNRHAAG